MPPIDKRPAARKPKPAARRGAVGRGADIVKPTLGPPAPKPKPTGVFKPGPPRPPTQRITIDAPKVEQRKVDTARRALPPATVAAPPVISAPSAKPDAKPSGKPMSKAQLEGFLKSQSKVTQHAREQIVGSIRKNLGKTKGAERQEMTDRLLREIATDPKYAATRKAIEHYTALEREHATPQTRATIKAGPKPRVAKAGLGPVAASINLTAAGQAIENAAEKAAPGLTSGSAPAQFTRNALKDIGTLGKAPFVGGVAVGSAIVKDVQAELTGDRENAGKHSTDLAKGILDAFVEEVKHPIKAIQEHPILTVLDAAGGVSAAGRGAGAAARGLGKKDAGGVRGAMDRHSHTVRPPIALVDDSGQPVLVQRTYSKDLTRRVAQVERDRGREPVRDPDGKAIHVTDRGRKVPVLKASDAERERHFKKRGDMVASRANAEERKVREETIKASKVKGLKGRHVKDIVAMAVEGTLTSAAHFADDLKAHRDRIADRIARHENGSKPFEHSGDVQAAHARLELVDRVLSDPKAMRQGPAVVAEAERHGARLREGDKASAAGKIGDENALNRAALSTTALEHMGARHFTVEEHAKLERDARKAEVAAVEKYQAAKTPAERNAALAELDTAREARIAVSGREPEGTRRHESAKAAHSTATKRVESLKAEETVAERRVQELTTQHKSERAREAHHGPVAKYEVHKTKSSMVDAAKQGRNAVAARLAAIDKRLQRLEADYHNAERLDGSAAAARVMEDIETLNADRMEAYAHLQRMDKQLGLMRAEFPLRKDAIAYAKANGIPLRQITRIALTSGEAKRVGEISQARRAHRAVKDRRRAAESDVRKGATAVKANPLPEANAALRYGEGNPAGRPAGSFLSNQDIEDFLRSRGREPGTVAHLTHRQDTRGARAHHTQLRPGNRPRLDGETRTGGAYLDRITESSEALIRDEGVRQATQLNKAKHLDKVIAETGLRHPAWAKAEAGKPLTAGEQRVVNEGGLFTTKEALETAKRIEKDTGQRFTPMTAHQARLSEDTRRIIREDLQGPGGMETLPQRLLNDRVVQPSAKPDARTRNVVLVPSELYERLEAHLRPAGPVEQFFQYLNKPFRFAVLPQPRWLTGNFGESYVVRLPTVGSGINIPGLLMDVHSYRQGVKALDNGTPEMKAAAEEIRAQQLGSGLFVGGKGGSVHRAAEDVLPQFAQRAYGKMVSKFPATRQMVELSRTAIHWIAMPLHAFFWINLKGIESPAQKIAFGHNFRRDLQAITGSWIKSVASGKVAAEEAARGLVNTPTQQRFMQDQYELLGKYAGMNPTLRAFTQSVAPFLPWMLNAARFVYWTMPAHNTVKTALLVKSYQTIEKDWDEIHRTVPAGGLKDAIPMKDGGWLDLARYTPWGLTAPIASGGNLASIPGQFTPQFGGAANALAGRDPFGRPLKLRPTASNPKGKPGVGDLVKIAGNSLLESVAPYLSTGRRLREHGETAFADSTIVSPKTKPGTSHGQSALERTYSPFRPTYLRAGGGTETVEPDPRFKQARDRGVADSATSRQDELLDRMYDAAQSDSAAQQRQDELLDRLYSGG